MPNVRMPLLPSATSGSTAKIRRLPTRLTDERTCICVALAQGALATELTQAVHRDPGREVLHTLSGR